MDFLDLIETIRAEEASSARLFGDAGVGVRHRQKSPRYLQGLAEAGQLVADVFSGKRPMHRLQEAMTTSDFPDLFGDILDRMMLGAYQEFPVSWNMVARRRQVRDFRTVKRFTLDGGEAYLGEVVEQEEYPAASLSDGYYSYSVKKYGRRLPFSWESMINDDLDAFRDIPNRLGRAARRSEERFVADLITGSSGPDGTFFSNGNANIVNTTNGAANNNPVLSISGLQDAMRVLAKQLDADSEPIHVEMVTLYVPPGLAITAQNILNATELRLNTDGGASNAQVIVNNWMKNRLRLGVNPYLATLPTSNGNTSWYLFASPEDGRPALEVGFLRGHEAPEIFTKAPNAQRVGGSVNPLDGDFDTDSVQYKVRHVFGGTTMDPKMAVASNGSGS